MKTAVLAGATGLVGGALLKLLLADKRYDRVIALTRRDFPVTHAKLEKVTTDFHQPEKAIAHARPDDIFCCLGTTMAKAGSKEKFYEVDFRFPLALAEATRKSGAKQFALVSALGANKRSAVYYNRVKGEIEEAISRLGFRTLHIFRPSLLLGPRTDVRRGEEAAKIFFQIFGFLVPEKYKAVGADMVARAMMVATSREEPGIFIQESKEIRHCKEHIPDKSGN